MSIAGQLNHLHIICTNSFFHRETGEPSVVAVNISSVRSNAPYDSTCVLRQGEHPFIKHDSFVYYRQSVVMRVSSILRGLSDGTVTIEQNVSDAVLQKVLDGFWKSPFTSRRILKLLENAQ